MRAVSDEVSAGFGCDSTAGRALTPGRLSPGLRSRRGVMSSTVSPVVASLGTTSASCSVNQGIR